MSSTWVVSTTHMAIAPFWLTVGIPILLTLICAVRVLHWWRSRHVVPTSETALHALKRMNYLAFSIASAFTVWSFYGGAYTRSHLAFHMAITVISCIFSLMHLHSAALIVAAIVNGALIFFFAESGQPTFVAAAVNIALVSIGMLVILTINQRDFTRMVNAQAEARRKHEEQSRLLSMIDDMPVAVMTVDPATLKITYANEPPKELIRKVEHLLTIEADNLVGTCIDVFRRNPQHQRRLLADPKNLPHNARIKLEPEVLDLKVSAVNADDGSYIGPMLTWALVTKEVEAESRIRQLAHYDTLTGLPNRVTFHEELVRGLSTPGNRIGLLSISTSTASSSSTTRGGILSVT